MSMKITKWEVMNITSRKGIFYRTKMLKGPLRRQLFYWQIYIVVSTFVLSFYFQGLEGLRSSVCQGIQCPKISSTPCQQIFSHSQQDHNPWLCKGPKLEQRTLGVGEQVKYRIFKDICICIVVILPEQKPTSLLALEVMDWMCWLQERSEAIDTPRYLMQSTASINIWRKH